MSDLTQVPAVSSRKHGAVTIVTLSRPHARNAVDSDTARTAIFVLAGTSRPVPVWPAKKVAQAC